MARASRAARGRQRPAAAERRLRPERRGRRTGPARTGRGRGRGLLCGAALGSEPPPGPGDSACARQPRRGSGRGELRRAAGTAGQLWCARQSRWPFATRPDSFSLGGAGLWGQLLMGAILPGVTASGPSRGALVPWSRAGPRRRASPALGQGLVPRSAVAVAFRRASSGQPFGPRPRHVPRSLPGTGRVSLVSASTVSSSPPTRQHACDACEHSLGLPCCRPLMICGQPLIHPARRSAATLAARRPNSAHGLNSH